MLKNVKTFLNSNKIVFLPGSYLFNDIQAAQDGSIVRIGIADLFAGTNDWFVACIADSGYDYPVNPNTERMGMFLLNKMLCFKWPIYLEVLCM